MSALDKIKQGKRLTAAFLYELLYGIANGDLSTENNNLPLWREISLPNYVVSGCVWAGDNYGVTLLASMSAGQVMIDGQLIDVDAVANRAFTASKDTYVDVDINGALYYTEVANNAASPALATGRIRLGVIVTAAGSIASVASINQGESNKTVPTTCNTKGSGKDSLGNYIFPNKLVQDLRLDRQTIYTTTGNGSTLGTGRVFYIGDMLYQTGSGYIGNGFTGWTNVNVNFAKAFSEVPIVTVCSTAPAADSEADNGYPIALRAASTSAITIRAYHGNSVLGSGYNWIAIGKA